MFSFLIQDANVKEINRMYKKCSNGLILSIGLFIRHFVLFLIR